MNQDLHRRCLSVLGLMLLGSPVAQAHSEESAFRLYRAISQVEKSPNLIFSPASLAIALQMTARGAQGQTRKEIENAFGRKPLAPPTGTHDYTFDVANRLWVQASHPLRGTFLAEIEKDFGAKPEALDFVRELEPARLRINRWVSEKTHDRINDLIPTGILSRNTRLVLTNAVYFKGAWFNRFDPKRTETGPFSKMPIGVPANGSESTGKAHLMRQTKSFAYTEEKDFALLELPYEDAMGEGDERRTFTADLAMDIILPKRVNGLPAIERRLGSAEWKKALSRLRSQEVDVTLPRFKAEQTLSAAETLQRLGIRRAFLPGKADFSGMNGQRDFYVSAVLHKAFVEVNEVGAEAAAATAVGVGMTSFPGESEPPKIFKADHPFLFLIRNTKTGEIWFMGRVGDPTT